MAIPVDPLSVDGYLGTITSCLDYANSLLTGLPVFHPPPSSLPTTARRSPLKLRQRMSPLCSKPSTGSHCALNKTEKSPHHDLPDPTRTDPPSTLKPHLLHHPYSLALLLCLKPASAPLHLLFLLPTTVTNPSAFFRTLAPEGHFLQATTKKAPFF